MDDATTRQHPPNLVSLEMDHPIWDRFFTVAPLVVIGTREPDGTYDLAPKHMATPLGWENYFGFVCTPQHATYQNICREEVFTVSFPTTDSVVLTSLAASPRCDDDSKPSLSALPTFDARSIDGCFLKQASVFLECRLDRMVDGFGPNSLIVGRIIAAHLTPEALRQMDVDDQETLAASPLLVYVSPGRYAKIDQTQSFPFPAGFQKRKDSST
jgi:flavin reductase (DIM6/NTAB) family NADH-FMN oxidoreductase RutF